MTKDECIMAAKVLRAMGHPVRLGVLNVLCEGPKTVSELFRELDCSQSMMSQQLQILEYHGLISSRKEGTHKYCSLTNPKMLDMLDCLQYHMREHLSGVGIASLHSADRKEEG